MAQVPYSGVPSIAPGGTPLSRYHANVSAETFGGSVGAALSSLGGQLQRSGNELFERGIAMQALYNQSEAQDADARFMETAGKLHAEYNSLQGKAAVDGYDPYIQSLKKAQEDIRKGLSNDTSQRMFDSASKGTLGRTIFNGAGHAAAQNKVYANASADARISAIGNQALSTPEDERSFKLNLDLTEQLVRAKSQLKGFGPDDEVTKEAIAEQKSKLWGERIKGLAKRQPLAAGRMLDDGIKRGDIRGEDIGRLTNIVQQQRNTVGARMISQRVATGEGLRMGQSIVPIEQAQEAIGTFESGGRYNLTGREVTDKAGNTGHALGKYQIMSYNLKSWLAEAGMPAMSEGEFLRSPSAQDQLFNFKFGGYMKQYGSFNDAATAWFAGPGSVGKDGSGRRDVHETNVPAYLANTNAILARNAPLAQKIDQGVKLAAAEVPDDPLFLEYVEQRIKTDNDRAIAVKRDTEFRNRQVVEDGLMGGESGKLPTTIEELTDTPDKAQAWQDLLPATQRRYMGVLARNAKGDRAWTDTSLREYQKLKGMAQSDPVEFADQDIVGSGLPDSARRELINLQIRKRGKAEGDPNVTRAMRILGPDLNAARISKRDNADDYFQFVGTLEDQLQDFMQEKKRPPNIDEVKKIGNQLLQQHGSRQFWFKSSRDAVFRLPVPNDEYEKLKADPAWAKVGITDPTPEQIQRAYTRSLYNTLFGGSVSKPSGAAK